MKYLKGFSFVVLFSTILLLVIASLHVIEARKPNDDDCEKCGPTRMIGCRAGRCYYKCIRRCLGKDNKFYYGKYN